MITHLRGWAVAWLILLATSTLAAASDKPAGFAQAVKGQALAVRAGQSRPIEAKDPIFSGDTLATKAESSLQAIFSDGTTVALGPESLFSVDEYVNEWGQEHTLSNEVRFSYGPGVFRAVTGIIAHRNPAAFSVQTPLGAIGIRGTELGSVVSPPAEASGMPYRAVLEAAFAPGADAAGIVAVLKTAASGFTSAEAHGHLAGSAKRPLVFTDKSGKSVNMAVDQGVTVTRERGVSEAGPLPVALTVPIKSTPINTSARIPSAYKATLHDNPGSNKSDGTDRDNSSPSRSSGGSSTGAGTTGGTSGSGGSSTGAGTTGGTSGSGGSSTGAGTTGGTSGSGGSSTGAGTTGGTSGSGGSSTGAGTTGGTSGSGGSSTGAGTTGGTSGSGGSSTGAGTTGGESPNSF
ncbi:FecR family protein [Desulfolutivibrio sulfoxidireducens]|uniref:FecR family protein n=1 Tax=Desulfolutivibrio sulfoxidireducens TaxID=2773299 RepID=UPI00159E7F6B|nr:FecR domain-containing protein [Desulfolutivibrio sulfoxidireducens]QLA15937.1 hypothetical protein GD605_07150 [Desulfolutivibrio sulfoxidireducens]